eukprot:12586062-Alexandrium_andersonii.AAC.1
MKATHQLRITKSIWKKRGRRILTFQETCVPKTTQYCIGDYTFGLFSEVKAAQRESAGVGFA